ncbi:MAG: AMP-binding protein [Pyramidobacter sp.]|nr:AMP-binding protein [Pyramidobacter sp.]
MYGRIEEHIAARIAEDPQRECVVFEGVHLTRAQIGGLAAACRASLEASGFKPGMRLVTVLPNSPLMLALSLAVWQLKGAVVPLSHHAGMELVFGAIKLVDPFAVITMKGVKELEAFAEKLCAAGVSAHAVSIAEPLPVITGNAAASLEDESMAVVFATSGTTGLPKAVPLTHENVLSNILNTCEHVYLKINEDQTVLTLLPNFHVFGFCLSSTLPLVMGYKQVVLPSFMPPSRTLNALYKEGITVIIVVPTIVGMLCEGISRGPKVPPPFLKKIVCGGAPCDVKLHEKAKMFLGIPIHEGYGLTECASVVSAVHEESEARPGFIGPFISCYEHQLRTVEGEVITDGDEGVLWVKGPCVAKGYFRMPQATAERYDNGWFNTGDVVKLYEDGYMKIIDRATDIIIVSGFNVYPQEVENYLMTHPAVADCAVVGSPNAISGEIVKAFVVVKPDVQAPTERELINFCKDALSHYKTPRAIEFVEELPRNAVGKVLRRKLRDLERQRFAERGKKN